MLNQLAALLKNPTDTVVLTLAPKDLSDTPTYHLMVQPMMPGAIGVRLSGSLEEIQEALSLNLEQYVNASDDAVGALAAAAKANAQHALETKLKPTKAVGKSTPTPGPTGSETNPAVTAKEDTEALFG